MNNTLLKIVQKSLLKRAARRTILDRCRCQEKPEKCRFNRADVRHVLKQTWRNYDELAPDIPSESAFASRMGVRIACMLLSLYRALLATGVKKDYATSLIGDLLWKMYKKFVGISGLISRILSRDPKKRMRICVKMFYLIPCKPPGYVYKVVPDDDENNAIAIKWTRCPVIDYFRQYKLDDICLAFFCNMDYAIVDYWGGWLDRPSVMSEGANCCYIRCNVFSKVTKNKSK